MIDRARNLAAIVMSIGVMSIGLSVMADPAVFACDAPGPKEPDGKHEIVLKLRHGSLLARAKAQTGPQYYLCPADDTVFLADSQGKVACPKCGSTQCVRVVDEIDRMMSRSWNFVESMRVKDKPFGYIRWSRSAYDDYSFFASHNAMYSLYSLMRLGYEPAVTQEQFVEWCETFHSWIDPKTGLVEDEPLLKRVGCTKNYMNGMCLYTGRAGLRIQWVSEMAGWPLDPDSGGPRPIVVPKETREKDDMLPLFKNVDDAREWIEKVKDTDSYAFGATVAHALGKYDRYLEENNLRDNGVIPFFHEWLDEHQDPNTGFWGSEKWPLHLGAAGYFKLVSHGETYRRYGWEPRYRDKVIDTCLRIQDERGRFGSSEACIILDALKNLRVVSTEIDHYRWDDVRLAAARSVLPIRACWKEDERGFSDRPGCSCTGHCGIRIAPSRDEADMHALTIWTYTAYEILLILLDEEVTEK